MSRRVDTGHFERLRNVTPSTSFLKLRGGLIAVEHPMNYFRPLITKLKNGLRGKSFPRQVTAPNGSPRWQAATGKSFATFEEASSP